MKKVTYLKEGGFLSIELSEQTLKDADCVELTTNHDAFDLEFIQKYTKMIVDMRNMMKKVSEKVYKL